MPVSGVVETRAVDHIRATVVNSMCGTDTTRHYRATASSNE